MKNIEQILNGESVKTPNALSRRSFFQRASALSAMSAIPLTGLGFLKSSQNAEAASGPGLDAAVLNFALNLEYLEAEYYLAAIGSSLAAQGVAVTGDGTPGGVTIKANPAVAFATPAFQQYANEIAMDELNHVKFLRAALIAAGVQPAARPAIDLLNSFNAAAVAGNIGPSFDPFANEINFLLGAFVFEDVGVTAYKGGARLITNKDYLEAAAGILGVEAYHAGIIRTVLNQQAQDVIDIVAKISDLRDGADGPMDLDQPIRDMNNMANLVPTDANSIAFSRTTRQVLNIVYLNGDDNNHGGGFFPNGLNGVVR